MEEVKKAMEEVKKAMEEVKKAIEKVERDILGVERELKEPGADVAYLREEKKQLREKEKQLLEKEKQLLEEKNKLWDREKQLGEEKLLLLRALLLTKSDLVVQNEKAGNVGQITLATQTIQALKKRSGEHIEAYGLSKRPRLFQEPLWHCVPNFLPGVSSGLDKRFTPVSDDGVMVMGRSALGPLRKNVYDMINRELGSDDGCSENTNVILVHGPMGSGKSHIVLLLVWDLTEEFASRPLSNSKRVRFISVLNCEIVIDDNVEGLLDPFIWAFADDEKSIQKLIAISDFKQLRTFLRNTNDTLVYVLDQWQNLENYSNAKSRLITIINSSKYSFQIRVTSAGAEELQREVLTSHPAAFLHAVSGGIQRNEMASFNLLHGTGCESKAVQALVDEQLGRNPFMLALWRKNWLLSRRRPGQPVDQGFLNYFKKGIKGGAACILGVGKGTALPSEVKASDKDLPKEEGKNVLRIGGGDGVGKEKEAGAAGDATEAEVKDWEAWGSFMNSSAVQAIRMCIRGMLDKLNSDVARREELVEVLRSIVFSGDGVIAQNNLSNINLRYFVFDVANGGRLSCSFPLVRAELARFLDESQGILYFHNENAWTTLNSAVDNQEATSVVGLFAERCCNAAIAVGGGHMAILRRATKKPTVKYFQTGKEKEVAEQAVQKFKTSGKDEVCYVFLPQSPFYEAVDNILVRLWRVKKAPKKAAKDEKKAVEDAVEDICMDLAKTQVTLQSMEKHSVSTISAMAPKAILPWIGEVDGEVQVTMAYVVPGNTIDEGTEVESIEGCSPKLTIGERGALRRQVKHTLLRISFQKVHEKLKVLDQWSSHNSNQSDQSD